MSYLQVASINLEHLSGASRASKPQTAYALTEHIEMAGVDILAMQEIYVTSEGGDGQRRNEILDRVVELLAEHNQGTWEYEIYPNRSTGDTSQLCSLMWNTERVQRTGVTRLNVSHKDGRDNLWDRSPHAVKFTSPMGVWRRIDGEWEQVEENKSIVVVPLHMKSNYGGVTKNIVVRHKEALTLCDQLEAIRTDIDASIVLIGDTNCTGADEPAIATFIENGLIDLNNFDSATYWSPSYGESPFDRAFVSEGRDEFKYTRQYVLKSADLEKHDRFLSDHFMIKISIKLYLDDADQR